MTTDAGKPGGALVAIWDPNDPDNVFCRWVIVVEGWTELTPEAAPTAAGEKE